MDTAKQLIVALVITILGLYVASKMQVSAAEVSNVIYQRAIK